MLLKIYVDDSNQAGKCIPYGTKYHKGRLYIPKVGWKGRRIVGTVLSDEILSDKFRQRQTEYQRQNIQRDRDKNGQHQFTDKLQMIFYLPVLE